MPRASVIIPTYNEASKVLAAYSSVAAQTISDLEIIFVDDASQDRTIEILRSLERNDRRIRVIAQSVNRGPSVARNAALTTARGDWIAILDADDSFLSDRLERLITVGEALGADIIVDNLRIIDPATGEVKSHAVIDRKQSGFLSFVEYLEGIQGSMPYDFGFFKPIINRQWLVDRELRYRANLRQGEDVMFILDAFMLKAKIFLEMIPRYNYSLMLDWRYKAPTTNALVTDRYDLLAEATKDFHVRHAKQLTAEATHLLRQRYRLLKRVAALFAFHLARSNRDLSSALKLVCTNPICLAAGINQSRRLSALRKAQQRVFRLTS